MGLALRAFFAGLLLFALAFGGGLAAMQLGGIGTRTAMIGAIVWLGSAPIGLAAAGLIVLRGWRRRGQAARQRAKQVRRGRELIAQGFSGAQLSAARRRPVAARARRRAA